MQVHLSHVSWLFGIVSLNTFPHFRLHKQRHVQTCQVEDREIHRCRGDKVRGFTTHAWSMKTMQLKVVKGERNDMALECVEATLVV